MTLDDAIAALTPGCCTREAAAESGCVYCVPKYAAMDWLRDEARNNAAEIARQDAVITRLTNQRARYELELVEIQRIAEPGRAWPYDRVTRCLEGE